MHVLVAGSAAPTHIAPHLSTLRELVRRGHRVSYAIDERCFAQIAPSGASLTAVPSRLPTGVAGDEWPTDGAEGMAAFLEDSLHALPLVHAAFDGDRPDVVLHDIGGAHGPLLAHAWAVPAVQLSPTYVAWDGYEQDMAAVIEPIEARARTLEPYRRMQSLMVERGIEGDPGTLMGRPQRSLVLVPRVMQPNADRVDAGRYRFVGPAIDLTRDAAGPAFARPEGTRRLLYVAFGTAYNAQPDTIAAVLREFGEDPAWAVVVAAGRTPIDRAALPANVTVFDTAPQLSVLAAADVFVTHAGMGSVSEALWFGVPMVCFPQAVDQPINAATVERLGVAVTVDDADDVPAAVRRVAEDAALRRAMDDVAAAVRAEGGAGRAADAIEEVAGGAW